MTTLNLRVQNSREAFSPCGSYRWWLKREIGFENRKLLFIGLNPSNANALRDDPTLKRLIGFCKSWKYGSLVVVNLFARIGKSPSILRICSDPVGFENNSELKARLLLWANNSDWDLWLGWGAKGILQQRNLKVLELLKEYSNIRFGNFPNSLGPLAIGVTKGGQPMHPLYSPKSKLLKPFEIL